MLTSTQASLLVLTGISVLVEVFHDKFYFWHRELQMECGILPYLHKRIPIDIVTTGTL